MEYVIQSFSTGNFWYQIRKSNTTNKYIFVKMQLGRWTTDEDADPDEIQETWLETTRKNFDDAYDATEEMLEAILSDHTEPTGHGY